MFSQIQCEDKWIVVTTIQYPTEELKKLAALPGWRLVVVGDKKTPADWYLANCEYLSVERQMELGYEITGLLPWNHYCRKNIGYLYAIQNGAQVIYETDDDTSIIDEIAVLPEEYALIEVGSTEPVVNIYEYFGASGVWPRGYPLEYINKKGQIQEGPMADKRIGIQQGLVNKDPDVDAIFRLTQGREVYFADQAPCAVQQGKFCPFNTQNTIFLRSTFWGLYLPCTTPFRVCDIWRGYIVQRLLWDIGHSLCFTKPTAIQNRNYHNCLADFHDECDLYLKAGALVNFLTSWKDDAPLLDERMLALVKTLTEHHYFHDQEIEIMRAWFNDLNKLGYPLGEFTNGPPGPPYS